MGVFSYHDSYPIFGQVHEWVLVKVSAALLIVCERNFYCLIRSILLRTKSGWVTEKGIRAVGLPEYM